MRGAGKSWTWPGFATVHPSPAAVRFAADPFPTDTLAHNRPVRRPHLRLAFLLPGILTVLVHMIGVPSVSAQSFTSLGSLPSHPEGISTAHGVSDDGSVVIGYSSSGSFENEAPREAFRWTSGGMTGLGTLRNGFASQAYAVSGDGSTVVGQSNSEVFRWTSGDGMKRIYLGINMRNGDAKGVSANGGVVVGYAVGSGTRVAFRRTETGVTMLPAIRTGARTEATAVSADGSVVVGFSDSQITRWQGGAVTALGPGFAQGVSADGSIVVGYNIDEGRSEAFTWTTETGIVPLAGFPGGSTRANDVSDDGTIVVGEASVPGMSDSPLAAAVWTPDGTVRLLKDILEDQGLDLTGWTLRTATGVSADGRVIVGFGINPNGSGEAWRAEILPIVVDEIVVNSTADEPNDPISLTSDVCDVDREEPGDQCTLRAAIELANARGGGTIVFDIPGEGVPSIKVKNLTDVVGVPFIRQESLPRLTSPITIDGTTQPGTGWVEISGPERSDDWWILRAGLWIGTASEGCTIRGLVINGFDGAGLFVQGNECLIEGNRIGTDATGTQARGNTSGRGGIWVQGRGNVIADNIIAGNLIDGIGAELMISRPAQMNQVVGNRIGVGVDGRVIGDLNPSLDVRIRAGIALGGDNNVIGGLGGDPSLACENPCNIVYGYDFAIVASDNLLDGDLHWNTISLRNKVFGNAIGVNGDMEPVAGSLLIGPRVMLGAESTVEGNYIAAINQGALSVGSSSLVRNNVIVGHAENGGVAFAGLVSLDGSDSELRRNEITTSGMNGVVLTGEGGHHVIENEISGHNGGIVVTNGEGNSIESNEITENRTFGVLLSDFFGEPGALITRNRIYNNGIGIDLGGGSATQFPLTGNGVTPNDVSDIDQGPNGLLNFPVPLQAQRTGGAFEVEGVLWGAFSGEYVVEVFANSSCAESRHFGFPYGAGEHYLGSVTVTPGITDFGEPAFSVVEDGLEEHYRYITLTASRHDLGVTSEFSRCIPLADVSQTARTEVEPGETGLILDAQGVTVTIMQATASTENSAHQSSVESGKLYLTRYETAPDPSLFADTTAVAPGGSRVRPEAVAARHWYLADRGLTAASGEAEDGSLAFEVCLDPTDVVVPASLAEVVLVQRSDATEGQWLPNDTYSHDYNGTTYICATGLSALGEFSIGGAEDALPTSIQEPDREVPGRISLGQNYPNPFNPQTVIPFDLNVAGNVKIEVYDMLGRHVQTLVNATMPAGRHQASFDAGRLSSGIYIYRLETGSELITRKMMLIR